MLETLEHACGVSIPTKEVHDDSIESLIVYGFNHFVGNVQQARRTAHVRSMLATQQNVKPAAITTQQIKAWNESHPAEAKAILDGFVKEAIEDLRSGKVGVRETRTRTDERTKRFNRKVLARFNAFLKSQELAMEKDEAHVYQVKGVDGIAVGRTRDQLINALVERKGTEIWTEVDAELAAEAQKAQAANAAADFV